MSGPSDAPPAPIPPLPAPPRHLSPGFTKIGSNLAPEALCTLLHGEGGGGGEEGGRRIPGHLARSGVSPRALLTLESHSRLSFIHTDGRPFFFCRRCPLQTFSRPSTAWPRPKACTRSVRGPPPHAAARPHACAHAQYGHQRMGGVAPPPPPSALFARPCTSRRPFLPPPPHLFYLSHLPPPPPSPSLQRRLATPTSAPPAACRARRRAAPRATPRAPHAPRAWRWTCTPWPHRCPLPRARS